MLISTKYGKNQLSAYEGKAVTGAFLSVVDWGV